MSLLLVRFHRFCHGMRCMWKGNLSADMHDLRGNLLEPHLAPRRSRNE